MYILVQQSEQTLNSSLYCSPSTSGVYCNYNSYYNLYK